MKRLPAISIAFILVLTLILSLTACDDDKKQTTTAETTSSVSGETTSLTETTTGVSETITQIPVTTTQVPVTTTQMPVTTTQKPVITTKKPVTTTKKPVTTTKKPVTTTKKPVTTTQKSVTTTKKPVTGITAPAGSNISKIVTFYNQYANSAKAYKGKVKITKADGTTTVINSISGGNTVKNLAQDMLPNDYSAKPVKTFINGKASDGTTLASHLPRGEGAKMSVLQAAGVKSASCVKSGSGWKVTISLRTETVNELNGVPKYTSQCMDTLSLTADDLKPFTLESAKVNYIGCKIIAVLDSAGRFTKLDITTPANITGKLKYGFIGINADVTGTYEGNFTFSY